MSSAACWVGRRARGPDGKPFMEWGGTLPRLPCLPRGRRRAGRGRRGAPPDAENAVYVAFYEAAGRVKSVSIDCGVGRSFVSPSCGALQWPPASRGCVILLFALGVARDPRRRRSGVEGGGAI